MAERKCESCSHNTGVTDEKFCPKCGQETVSIKAEVPKKKAK